MLDKKVMKFIQQQLDGGRNPKLVYEVLIERGLPSSQVFEAIQGVSKGTAAELPARSRSTRFFSRTKEIISDMRKVPVSGHFHVALLAMGFLIISLSLIQDTTGAVFVARLLILGAAVPVMSAMLGIMASRSDIRGMDARLLTLIIVGLALVISVFVTGERLMMLCMMGFIILVYYVKDRFVVAWGAALKATCPACITGVLVSYAVIFIVGSASAVLALL
ncbi:MAG: hypothetical protein ABH879_04855 [archaeon]